MPDSTNAPPADLIFETVPSLKPEAQVAQHAYYAEMAARFKEGFDVSLYSGKDSGTATPAEEVEDEFAPPRGVFILGYLEGVPEAAACGGVRLLEPGVAEIKRMWVSPSARGRRVATRLLAHLEAQCVALGAHTIRLDTKDVLHEAIAMYKKYGYYEVPRYNDNPYATHFFEKKVAA
jgi:ribosomal protein S18 acetylase RimI-like enzyme